MDRKSVNLQTIGVTNTSLRPMVAITVYVLAGIIGAAAVSADQGDWPQWRGAERTGQISAESTLPARLTGDQGITLAWEMPLGPSYSGPVISDGILVTTETVDKKDERVTAIDVATGDVLWTNQWPGAISVPFFAKKNGDWIRATPAIAEGRVYVAGIRDLLVCLDLRTGEKLWECNFPERFNTEVPSFGFASSPLVDAGAVYVQAGNSVCKLDAPTGETLWRTLSGADGGDSAFSSPIIAALGGVRQLVVQTREDLCGVNLEDGKVLWNQPIEAFRGMNILTPTVIDDQVFTSAYGGRANLWKVGSNGGQQWTIAEQWDEKHQAYMSSPVLIDGHLYIHLRNTRFACIDLKTGSETWVTEPVGDYWSLVFDGDTILALSSDGVLRLIKASPEKYNEIDSLKVAEDSSWAHVAVAGDRIVVRSLGGIKVYQHQR
jgi:outer membrane protein assembly factor BamB